MPFRYKVNALELLKKSGYSTYRIRKENIFSQGTLTILRNQKPVGWDILETICRLTNSQPGDIIEYVPDDTQI